MASEGREMYLCNSGFHLELNRGNHNWYREYQMKNRLGLWEHYLEVSVRFVKFHGPRKCLCWKYLKGSLKYWPEFRKCVEDQCSRDIIWSVLPLKYILGQSLSPHPHHQCPCLANHHNCYSGCNCRQSLTSVSNSINCVP